MEDKGQSAGRGGSRTLGVWGRRAEGLHNAQGRKQRAAAALTPGEGWAGGGRTTRWRGAARRGPGGRGQGTAWRWGDWSAEAGPVSRRRVPSREGPSSAPGKASEITETLPQLRVPGQSSSWGSQQGCGRGVSLTFPSEPRQIVLVGAEATLPQLFFPEKPIRQGGSLLLSRGEDKKPFTMRNGKEYQTGALSRLRLLSQTQGPPPGRNACGSQAEHTPACGLTAGSPLCPPGFCSFPLHWGHPEKTKGYSCTDIQSLKLSGVVIKS